ncbi:MAG TPA: RsmE family RNA methyltransferase [Elusimicrobiales bacterium]|nr:RsmE family RNA methyltransferase [Elusimicrobiales bacterium]
MPQYLIPPENIRGGDFVAGEEEANHIARAARVRAGDEIEIFDGLGNRYRAVVKTVAPGVVSGSIKEKLPSPEYITKLTLCFGVPARSALESALERCTAAGVEVFQPMLSSRVQFDLFSNWERKLPRLEQIAAAACKQCGRGRLPAIRRPEKFDELLQSGGAAVIAAADGVKLEAAAPALAGKTGIKLFVGPEGGFTKGELEFARSNGALFVNLGLHTLRTEDACFAAACALLTRLG